MLVQLGTRFNRNIILNRNIYTIITYKLFLNYVPTLDSHLVTKQYVDDTLANGLHIDKLVKIDGSVTVTSPLTVVAPIDNNHAITKSYLETRVDTYINSAAAIDPNSIINNINANEYLYKTGDIIEYASSTPPIGFLKCDGSSVLKSSYGDLYTVLGGNSNTTTIPEPYKMQYDFNTTQISDLSEWDNGIYLPCTLGMSNTILINNRIYIVGGYMNGAYSGNVYSAPISEDSSIGVWRLEPSFTSNTYNNSLVTKGTTLYVIGGYINNAIATTVYKTNIGIDGALDAWVADVSMPYTISQTQTVIINSRVYMIGGYRTSNGTSLSTVYYSVINPDGTLEAWTSSTAFPVSVYDSFVIKTNSRIYIMSGIISGSWSNKVYYAVINPDDTLGTWTADTNIPAVTNSSPIVVTRDKIYIIGKYKATIDSNGVIGTWASNTTIINTISNNKNQVIATDNKIYLLGGYVSSLYSKEVFSYPVNVDGSVGTLIAKPTMPSVYINTAVVTKNRVYSLGGYIGGHSNAIYTCPINSDGSLGTWVLDTNVLPMQLNKTTAIVTSSMVYLIGGDRDGSYYSDYKLFARINSDGTLGTWSTVYSAIPNPLMNIGTTIIGNFVYLIGGQDYYATGKSIYVATINSSGVISNFTYYSTLPVAMTYLSVIKTKSKIYLIGTDTISSTENSVYVANINNDYSIGDFSYYGVVPNKTDCIFPTIVSTRNMIYVLGGYTYGPTTDIKRTIMQCPINSDDTLGDWVSGGIMSFALGYGKPIITSSKMYIVGGTINGSPTTELHSCKFLGGSNDYTDISSLSTASDTFNLPNIKAISCGNSFINSYIKT